MKMMCRFCCDETREPLCEACKHKIVFCKTCLQPCVLPFTECHLCSHLEETTCPVCRVRQRQPDDEVCNQCEAYETCIQCRGVIPRGHFDCFFE